jgi:hypothetical protein
VDYRKLPLGTVLVLALLGIPPTNGRLAIPRHPNPPNVVEPETLSRGDRHPFISCSRCFPFTTRQSVWPRYWVGFVISWEVRKSGVVHASEQLLVQVRRLAHR